MIDEIKFSKLDIPKPKTLEEAQNVIEKLISNQHDAAVKLNKIVQAVKKLNNPQSDITIVNRIIGGSSGGGGSSESRVRKFNYTALTDGVQIIPFSPAVTSLNYEPVGFVKGPSGDISLLGEVTSKTFSTFQSNFPAGYICIGILAY